jgi:hypothetical protein
MVMKDLNEYLGDLATHVGPFAWGESHASVMKRFANAMDKAGVISVQGFAAIDDDHTIDALLVFETGLTRVTLTVVGPDLSDTELPPEQAVDEEFATKEHYLAAVQLLLEALHMPAADAGQDGVEWERDGTHLVMSWSHGFPDYETSSGMHASVFVTRRGQGKPSGGTQAPLS